jgi:hypothetical protein
VYQHRNGRLTAPAGGYTAGEAWWLGRLVAHEVDVTPHEFAFACDLSGVSGAEQSYVEGTATWRVADPVALVAHRVTDAPLLCRRHLAERTSAAVGTGAGRPLARVVEALARPLDLPGGLRVEGVRLGGAEHPQRRPGDPG